MKASMERAAPVSPLLQAPVRIITNAVMVQTMMVSMKVPSMPIMPCCTGSLVCAAAWAMGALPRPASLEKMPRATPKRIAAHTAASNYHWAASMPGISAAPITAGGSTARRFSFQAATRT